MTLSEKQIGASYVGIEMTPEQVVYTRQAIIDYMMAFFPIPVLRKPTKRGRLRYEGKLRARERIRRLYAGE